MNFLKKPFFFGLFFLLLVSSYFSNSTFADVTGPTANPVDYVETIKVADIYNSDHKMVGALNTGIQIGTDSIHDGKVFFYLEGILVSINEEDTKLVDPKNLCFSPIETVLEQTANTIKINTHDRIEVYTDTNFNKVILTLEPEMDFEVTKGDGDYYNIIVGKRAGVIKASANLEVVSQSSTSQSTSSATKNSSTAVTSTAVNETITSVAASSIVPTFVDSTHYFQVVENSVSIYDNSTGSLKHVGYLKKGQVYPRVSDYGDWHQIKYGNGYGYVWKASTIPASGTTIKDLNPGLTNSGKTFIPTEVLTVYDNTSGSLDPFASLSEGVQYPFISDMGDWYQVDVAGRIGYVYKPATIRPFEANDHYFQVNEDYVSIYDNSTGSLKQVGYLKKGQVYPRVSDYGDWHQIKYGNGYGYVWKASTIPSIGTTIKDLNPGLTNTGKTFIPTEVLTVYDNTSGSLVPLASLSTGVSYPYISDMGDWYQVDVAGRIGYVYKPATTRPFEANDRYFEVKEDNVSIYDNSTGSLKHVGYLNKGQVYPRVSDYGDWHQIKYGNGYGYVWKASTSPTSSTSIKDLNTGLFNTNHSFIPTQVLTVYDNSTGKLVPFASLSEGIKYPFISDLGEWYKVDVAGRVGYVYKPATKSVFLASDHYFKAAMDDVGIYDNSTGSLKLEGYLKKGEIYRRTDDYGDWHQIKFGNKYGYVWKDDTELTDNSTLKNESQSGTINTSITFKALTNLTVYDNTSGSLVPFGVIITDQVYPAISISGDWVQIELSGRIGYVYKGAVQIGPIYKYTSYNMTLNQMWDKQMTVANQTDKKYSTYIRSDALKVNDITIPTYGTVVSSGWNVRGGPGTSYWTVGTLNDQEGVTILNKVYNDQDGYWWYQIKYNRTWVNPSPDDVKYYLDPANFSSQSKSYLQFLSLSQSAGVSEQEVNDNILAGKGILAGRARAFISAGNTYNINEIYLISHALLETGNGQSELAKGVWVNQVNGVSVEPKMVYNMYGIHAFDTCPLQCGSEYAYQQGWFTPEAAIIGGAQWIGNGYINDPTNRQDTLYKMKWNPAYPATGNYASDIAWAYKQVNSISNLYSLLKSYILVYDVPTYK